MKKILTVIPLVILLCCAFTFQNKEAKTELGKKKVQSKVETQNKIAVRHLYEAIDGQDFDKCKELISPDGIFHVAGVPEALYFEFIIPSIKLFYEAFPDGTHIIKDIISEGERVAVRFIKQGIHKGDYGAIPPTGNKVQLEGIHIFRLAKGKIVEGWIVEDNLGMARQLGMELKMKLKHIERD